MVKTIVNEGESTTIVGPGNGTSTNNAVVRWQGTSGNTMKDSVVIVDDSGNMSGVSFLNAQSEQLNAVNNQITVQPGTNKYFLNFSNPAANRIISMPDPGTNANWVLSEGAQTINGATTFSQQLLLPFDTGQIKFNSGSKNGVLYVQQPASPGTQVYMVPDFGASCSFIMELGSQSISGSKTFLNVTNFNNIVNAQTINRTSGTLALTTTTSGDITLTPAGTFVTSTAGINQMQNDTLRVNQKNGTFNSQFYPDQVITTDATTTTIHSFSFTSGSSFSCYAYVFGWKTDNSNSLLYAQTYCIGQNTSGTATIDASSNAVLNRTGALTTATVSWSAPGGSTVNLNVTGAASTTVQWRCYVHVIYSG